MKIALITYEYPPDTALGGIATYARQAARVLAERNHYVEVFAASAKRSGMHADDGVRLNLVRELGRTRFGEAICPIFAARHREVGFDLVESPEYNADGREIRKAEPRLTHVVKMHTPSELLEQSSICRPQLRGWCRHHFRQARMLVGALRRFQRPSGLYSFQPDRLRSSALYEVERDYARQSDLVVSPSQALADWGIREWELDPARVMTVPYPYVPSHAMLQMPIGGAGNVIGFFGRLEQRKGVADLIEAIPLILQEEPQARFRFVGEPLWHGGTLERFDEYLKRRLKQSWHAVEILGGRPLAEMPAQYQAVDICVFPSIWENFPNVCLEAMAAGRAIVASNAGGMAEMIQHESNGLLVPPRDPQAIASAVLRLLRAPAMRIEFGTKSRQRLLESYNLERVGKQLEVSYEAAMELNRHARAS